MLSVLMLFSFVGPICLALAHVLRLLQGLEGCLLDQA